MLRLIPYRTAQNVIAGIVLTFVSIDRIKRAESLAASRAFAESIVQTVAAPLVVLDDAFRVVATNRAFVRLLGYEQRDVEGHSFFSIRDNLLAVPELRSLLESVSSGAHVENFALALELPTGVHAIQVNARRLEELDSSVGRILVVFNEVS
jgi:two-component system CheB/CheR fusion protein